MSAHNHKKLNVWHKAMDIVDGVYHLTRTLPPEEQYGLATQMRKSAVSIPTNIAEGSHRSTQKDFCSFLFIAFGSGAELETQIEIVKRQQLGNKEQFAKIEKDLAEVMSMLNKLIASIKTNR